MLQQVLRIIAIVMSISSVTLAVAEPPPLEAYGRLSEIRAVTISPDGKHFAYLSERGEQRALLVLNLETKETQGVDLRDVKANWVDFAGNGHVVLGVSETTRVSGFRGRFEYSAAFSYNLKTGKVVQLLKGTKDLFPAQSGLGAIVGAYAPKDEVLMPAFMGSRSDPEPDYDLLRVDLDNGRGRKFSAGKNRTIDWFADVDGTILAREDYDNSSNKYELISEVGGDRQTIYEAKTELIPIGVLGVAPDRSGLMVTRTSRESGFSALYKLGFDGVWSDAPVFAKESAEIDYTLIDSNRFVIGVQYSGLYPTYDFFDDELTQIVTSVQDNFLQSSVFLSSWTDDLSKLVFFVSGGDAPGVYYLLDRNEMRISPLTSTRPQIDLDDVAPVVTIEYPARDGLTIPAILTLPLSGETENLPLIAMPHGGPEAYDQVTFDWMAQYFASRGYAVLQPNFRGSDGFGLEFKLAGRGKWGREMQDDVTDGVLALIKDGYVDPERVCIVGGSYGGYSALAGGAYSPDLYRCVAAIAPVSDLPVMLSEEKKDHGSDHWVLAYWQRVIGDRKEDREMLKDVSPARNASSFQAPVLLIHGKDDLVVPIRQSEIMERALKRAGKDVEFVKLRGEDHNLSFSESRLRTLEALDAFISKHIGRQSQTLADAAPAP